MFNMAKESWLDVLLVIGQIERFGEQLGTSGIFVECFAEES